MPSYFDLEKYDKDPLDLIERNTDIVRHLRGNGIDGFEIKKILNNFQGLKTEFPISVTKSDKAKNLKIDDARRAVTRLTNNPAITDKEREYLCEMYNRLYQEQVTWEKGKSGGPVYKMPLGDCAKVKNASISYKQTLGRQTVLLHDYIQKHNTNKEMFLQKNTFLLISELFENFHDWKISDKRIAGFYKNNLLKF
jgi:hypothetical protein